MALTIQISADLSERAGSSRLRSPLARGASDRVCL